MGIKIDENLNFRRRSLVDALQKKYVHCHANLYREQQANDPHHWQSSDPVTGRVYMRINLPLLTACVYAVL